MKWYTCAKRNANNAILVFKDTEIVAVHWHTIRICKKGTHKKKNSSTNLIRSLTSFMPYTTIFRAISMEMWLSEFCLRVSTTACIGIVMDGWTNERTVVLFIRIIRIVLLFIRIRIIITFIICPVATLKIKIFNCRNVCWVYTS